MDKALNIELNGTPYPLEFGYGSVKLLGKYLNDDTYDGTVAIIQQLLSGLSDKEQKGKKLSFKMLDCLGYLVISGIENADPDLDHGVKPKHIVDLLFSEPEMLIPVVEAFVDQMPKPKESKKKIPEKRQATNRRTTRAKA
ncbi:hypothetical protein [Flagellimonas sp.]|uniref:hypothetical protein n=1 Tax=Flagellimonas sp. TaxID=2058762 RepID=UPI003F49D603